MVVNIKLNTASSARDRVGVNLYSLTSVAFAWTTQQSLSIQQVTAANTVGCGANLDPVACHINTVQSGDAGVILIYRVILVLPRVFTGEVEPINFALFSV